MENWILSEKMSKVPTNLPTMLFSNFVKMAETPVFNRGGDRNELMNKGFADLP
jgi:hypothetical protein